MPRSRVTCETASETRSSSIHKRIETRATRRSDGEFKVAPTVSLPITLPRIAQVYQFPLATAAGRL